MAVSDLRSKRRSNKRLPLFYFMSFTNPWSPLTAIVIVHIVYINESNPYSPVWTLDRYSIVCVCVCVYCVQ